MELPETDEVKVFGVLYVEDHSRLAVTTQACMIVEPNRCLVAYSCTTRGVDGQGSAVAISWPEGQVSIQDVVRGVLDDRSAVR